MINPSVKEKIKNVVHKNFQFDNKGNVIETSITDDATSNAINEMHNIVMGDVMRENND